MKKCLVCLVSDQTIPNIIVALQFRPDFLLLITTPVMERKGKSQAVLSTLALHGIDYADLHAKLEVREDSLLDFDTVVSSWIGAAEEEFDFTVNLTGGTKLMSIAAYDLFSAFGSDMIYVPIPRNEFLAPFPKRRPRKPVPLDARLSVREYLTAYGFTISNERQLDSQRLSAEGRKEVTCFLFAQYERLIPVLKWLGDQLHPLKPKQVKKGLDFSAEFSPSEEVQEELLDRLGFVREENRVFRRIDEEAWAYLRGGWLEERLYLALRSALPHDADVQLNVQSKDPAGNPNEFDVLFTLDNALYLVECKSLGAPEGSEQHVGATINDFLYKLGALRQSFGLTPRAYLATTAESVFASDRTLKPHLVERARQFNTKIVPLLLVKDLEAWFKDEFATNR